jgi:hypothetical protein
MGMRLFDDDIPRLVERSNALAVGVRMPIAAQVRDMLNVAFVSSLLREEGIPVAASLAFADRTDSHSRGIAPFAEPTPLAASAVKKLAPAVDPGRGFVAVDGAADGGLEIWGQLAPAWHRAEPLGFGGGSGHLVVTTTGPGVLEVSVGFTTIWIYERDRSFEPEHWVSTVSVVARAFPTSLGDWRSLVLLWLTRRVARGGHGGTLVVATDESRIDLPDTRRFEPPLGKLGVAYEAYEKLWRQETEAAATDSGVTPVDAQERLRTVTRLTGGLDAVANLASVDGAVILSRDDLAVVGLGPG